MEPEKRITLLKERTWVLKCYFHYLHTSVCCVTGISADLIPAVLENWEDYTVYRRVSQPRHLTTGDFYYSITFILSFLILTPHIFIGLIVLDQNDRVALSSVLFDRCINQIKFKLHFRAWKRLKTVIFLAVF